MVPFGRVNLVLKSTNTVLMYHRISEFTGHNKTKKDGENVPLITITSSLKSPSLFFHTLVL